MPNPVYLTIPEGPLRESCLEHFPPDALTPVAPEGLGRGEAAEPGVVLLAPGQLRLEELLALADRLLEGDGAGWRLAVVRPGHPPRIQTLSVGHRDELPEVGAHARQLDEHPEALLDLRSVLTQVSRARHDINNPLTSAMAEVQLLLMDVEEGEVREGLEIVQEQLRRIRDLVAATGHIRPPRRGGPPE